MDIGERISDMVDILPAGWSTSAGRVTRKLRVSADPSYTGPDPRRDQHTDSTVLVWNDGSTNNIQALTLALTCTLIALYEQLKQQ